jgi:tripeptidyl-peptidase-1
MEVTFLLAIRDPAALERKFWTVSDPSHPDYQNYLTLEQMNDFVRPAQSNIDTLLAWFRSHGVTEWTSVPNGDAYTIKTTASVIEAMLHVRLERFKSSRLNEVEIVRSQIPYSLPHNLKNIVSLVAGVSSFPTVRQIRSMGGLRRQNLFVTPTVVQQNLNIPAGTTGTNANNLQAVAQFLEQYYNPQDLQSFQQEMQVPVQPVARVIGDNQANSPGTEASLDIEYIMSTGRGVPTWFIYTSGLVNGQEPFVQWATNLNAMSTIPWVNTISYGDYENTISTTYMARLDVELQKMAVRGSSILFSSGDDGVGCNSVCSKQVANWPSVSPYVTSVGGVYGGRSSGWIGDSISSGGFSANYPMPAYQKAAVNAYMKSMATSLPANSYYNASNRAVPDVAAYSENVVVTVGGSDTIVGGTSCASPMMGGLFSLINDKLFAAGKKSLGFLNPLLYSTWANNPTIFQKVTSGNNADFCCPGFNANPQGGWCPISGMGVPDFQALVGSIGKALNVQL